MPLKSLYATIIGIDAYPQNPLYGCTKDALDIDLFLRQWCDQQQDKLQYKPAYFLSPGKVGKQRLDKYTNDRKITIDYKDADFANISSEAFQHLKSANDGDYCFFYYSGHGSQTEAPEEFQYLKSDRMNETMVCVDSRDPAKPEARDLIDKEIAYLLWDALKGKKLHCLIVMDSCHSGNNTRSFTDGIQYRFIGSARNKIPLDKYIGYDKDNSFYTRQGGNMSFPIADYVHLAAALDFEKAQESAEGGLFTSKLVEVLRSGATAKSYRDLMQQVVVAVHNRNSAQTPVAFSADDRNLDNGFLQQERLAFKPIYEVRFDINDAVWKLHAGAMDGLPSSDSGGVSTIKITGEAKEVKIEKVYADFSILDESDMKSFDKTREDYQALISAQAGKKITIGLSKGLLADQPKLQLLKNAYEKIKPLYFEIIFEQKELAPSYLVQLTEENNFVLTGADNDVPLFRRENDAESFLNNTESVGKWISTSEVFSENSDFRKEDFVITVEKIEGQALKLQNIDLVKGVISEIKAEEELVLSYRDNKQPAFRLNISIAPGSNIDTCFVAALYLDSKYGIEHNLIPARTSLKKSGSPVYFRTIIQNHETKTLPVYIDDKYKLYNINEISAFIKIFASDQPMNLERFRQESLELDDKVPKLRGDFRLDPEDDNIVKEASWNVFTHKVRIIGPAKERELQAGTVAEFSAFSVTVPEGIRAKAVAITGDDLQQKLRSTSMRSADGEADELKHRVFPPDDLFGDALVDDNPFAKGLNSSANNGIVMLEIFPSDGKNLVLADGETIEIAINKPKVQTRSAEDQDFEETVIPYGFDENSGLWYPLGYCDEDGVIHIQQIPEPGPGIISQTTVPLTRSLGGSVKMFFKKIFRRKERLNKLVLYGFNADGSWKELSKEPSAMKPLLEQSPDGKAVLVIHGLTGDTRHIAGSLKELAGFDKLTDFVLTYDYENLATPIKDAAVSLGKDLKEVGFGEAGIPSLTILAHSQGGLVTRWLVEKENGNQYVKKMILVGVSSAGSELAKLGSALLALLTHALNGPPVMKLAITGLSFVLKKMKLDPGRTLKDTKPGSDFIIDLSKNSIPAGVDYAVIGGDISLLNGYDGDDPFLKRLKKALMRDIVFPGIIGIVYQGKKTDIAVTLDSMQSIHGFDPAAMKVVASNHLSYFREKLIQNELLELLK